MPLNEYQCTECGHLFEEIQKFSDDPLEKCPECSGALVKNMSAPSFHLKGGGWAKDGYGNTDDAKEVIKKSKDILIKSNE